MLAPLIRTADRMVYTRPSVPQDILGTGSFRQLKVAAVADYFTSTCLSAECRLRNVTPDNYQDILHNWKPDLLFVESAFHGVGGEWRYELAKQPWYIRWNAPTILPKVVQFARELRIPAVFWNKDDGAFFDAFIDMAKLFPHVLTTDNTCVPKYKAVMPADATVDVLPMAVQTAFHCFTGFHFEKNAACFVGSYYRKILNVRRKFLDMVFTVCEATRLPLDIYDRNSGRLSHYFEFRYPKNTTLSIYGSVPYAQTAALYKQYALSVNVNSVTDSDTMLSRRVLEILACGGIIATNPSPVIQREFHDFCHSIDTPEQAQELFSRIRKDGPSADDKTRAEAGAAYVREHHSWTKRLEQIVSTIQ